MTDERTDAARDGVAPTEVAPGAATDGAASVDPRIELVGVSKRFGATQALDAVSIQLHPGTIHGLVGENGAGKSTLVKILAGVHQPDGGAILLDRRSIAIHGPAEARALGIAVVHQEPRLFPDLTVAENVFMGHAPVGRLGSIDWREMRRAADEIFESLSVHLDSAAIVRGLSMADQQLIEIAKALSLNARVLILDEPTASLSAHEVDRLFAIVRQTRDRGVAVLFVSHRLEEVFELCDLATVLRDGRHIVTAETAQLTAADLVRYMVGRSVSLFPRSAAKIGDVLLEVRGLTRAGEFSNISFSVRAGEIVGLAGLRGRGSDRGRPRPVRSRSRRQGRSAARRQTGELQDGVRGAAGRARLRSGGSAPGRPGRGFLDRRERDPPDHSPALPAPLRAGQSRAQSRVGIRRPIADPLDGRGRTHRGAVGREPAEGGHRQMAGHKASGAHPRRTDSRRRHRSEGGGPSHHLRPRGRRPGDRPDLRAIFRRSSP